MSLAAFPIARERGQNAASSSRAAWLDQLLRLDYVFLFSILGVTLLGLVVLEGGTHTIPHLASSASKQAVFLGVAIAALLGTVMVDYRWLNRAAVGIYLLNLMALVFVLVGGSRINGARSWIDFGPINWQPSETMKVATVLVCAQWVALHPDRLKGFAGLVVPGLICGVPALLILAQPDLGTAAIFFMLFLTMMWMGGASRRWLGIIILSALVGMGSVYPMLKPYQKARIHVFLNPESDPGGKGYNVIQSKIAIGSGGLFGKGWGEGTQCTQRFLPEHHTDFIFASTVEQFGALGGLLLLTGFLVILLRMIRTMDRARDRFGGLVASGLIAIFLTHICLNVGMTMGLVPVTGIPLPLMSYGGSFLVTTYVMFGVLLNVGSRRFTFIR